MRLLGRGLVALLCFALAGTASAAVRLTYSATGPTVSLDELTASVDNITVSTLPGSILRIDLNGALFDPTSTAPGSGLSYNNVGPVISSVADIDISSSGSITFGPTNLTGQLVFSTSSPVLQNGALSGSVAISVVGSGTVTFDQANTYTGSTTVSSGTLLVANASGLGSAAAGTTVLGTGTLELSGGITINGESMTISGSAANGALRSVPGNNSIQGSMLTLGGNTKIGVDAGQLKINETLTDSASFGFTKVGAGTLVLTSANTYDGTTTVSAGILSIQNPLSLGSTLNGTVVLSGGELDLNNAGGLSIVGEFLSLAGSSVSGAGALNSVAGSNTWLAPIQLTTNASIGVAAGKLTIPGSISGVGTSGLTKVGSGALVLNGPVTYTGSTIVSAGTLFDDTAIGGVSVLGGTLSGNGTAGPVAVSAATLAPGDTVGILSTGPVLLVPASTFTVQLNGPVVGTQYDQLAVTGTVSLGDATLNVIPGFTPASGMVFTIINNDGVDAINGIFAGLLEGTEFNTSGQTFRISYIGGDGNDVTLTALQADVAVSEAAPAVAFAGANTNYVITVTNNGPDAAANFELDDTLPPGTTLVGVAQLSGPAFTCTPGIVQCHIASLAAGATAQFSVTINVPSSIPPGTILTNTAIVTSSTSDPNATNNTANGSMTVSSNADLAVTKSGPPTVTAGTSITYTLTVTNNGPADAQSVTLSDATPVGTTFVSNTQTGGPTFTCTPGAVNCSIATLTAGASATFTVVFNVASSVTNGTVISNTALVTSVTGDAAAGNNTATQMTTVDTSADDAVTKSAPASVVAGNNMTYTLTVTNNGPSDAQSVSLNDSLPPGTTFVSNTQTGGPAFACTPGAVNCTIAALAAGQTATFNVTVNVNAALANGTMLSNTAVVSSATADGTPGNNSSTAATTVGATADVSVTKSGPSTVIAGNTITYTLTVANGGASDAQSVNLTDTLPPGTMLVTNTQTGGPSFICTPGVVNCSIATLAAGASATFTVTANVSPGLSGGTTISNTAVGSSATADSNPSNNSSTTAATVNTSADVAVTKIGPATVTAGNNITYTLTVTNNGPSDAQSVSLTDATPTGTTFVSNTQTSGPAFTCTGSGVNCSIATLPSGATASFSVVDSVPIATSGGTVITNTVTATSSTPDSSPANNSSTATTTVLAAAVDLSISKTASPPPYGTGLPITYTVTVTNLGAAPATAVTVTDVLPAGLTLVSASPTQGTCSGSTTVTCSLGTLGGGSTATITISAMLPSTPGSVSNTASVSTSSPDSNPANDSATVTVSVVNAASIPTLSELMLLLLALALAVIAAVRLMS